MSEYEESRPGAEDRRKMVLTKADLEEIRRVTGCCPNGMTPEDAFKLRDFLSTWDRARSAVGGYVIKVILALVIAIAVLVAWVTNGGGKP
jgi:hypothetical protein